MSRFNAINTYIIDNRLGLNELENIYLYKGNVYNNKEYLKQKGGKYNKDLNCWYSSSEISLTNIQGVQLIKINKKELLNTKGLLKDNIKDIIELKFQELNISKENYNKTNTGNLAEPWNALTKEAFIKKYPELNINELYLGDVGETVCLQVTCISVKQLNKNNKDFYAYNFKVKEHLYVQCFSSHYLCNNNENINIFGKIKEHYIYKGNLETKLEKVSKVSNINYP